MTVQDSDEKRERKENVERGRTGYGKSERERESRTQLERREFRGR